MHSHQRNFRENFAMPAFNPNVLGGRDADEGKPPKGTLLGGRNPDIPYFIRNFKKMFTYKIETGGWVGIVIAIIIICVLLYLWTNKKGPFASNETIVPPVAQYVFF
jgi:hypothetical protein